MGLRGCRSDAECAAEDVWPGASRSGALGALRFLALFHRPGLAGRQLRAGNRHATDDAIDPRTGHRRPAFANGIYGISPQLPNRSSARVLLRPPRQDQGGLQHSVEAGSRGVKTAPKFCIVCCIYAAKSPAASSRLNLDDVMPDTKTRFPLRTAWDSGTLLWSLISTDNVHGIPLGWSALTHATM